MARILVVEDEASIQALIELYLTRDGHDVATSANGLEALQAVEQNPQALDLVVLDLMLPGLDGRGVCRRIRQISDVPVIMVTALDDPRDKLGGFDLGADDYVTKPFDPAELTARVRAVLKRTRLAAAEPSKERIVVGNIVVDLQGRTVRVQEEEIHLRVKEFDLLALLARNVGQVIPRVVLAERVWDDLDPGSRTLDVHISRVREKLGSARASVTIDTVRTIGYRLSDHR